MIQIKKVQPTMAAPYRYKTESINRIGVEIPA